MGKLLFEALNLIFRLLKKFDKCLNCDLSKFLTRSSQEFFMKLSVSLNSNL